MDQQPQSGYAGAKKASDKFLEACLLMLLISETGHGYALMEQLERFGFSPGAFNLSTLYRTLRHMEKAGYLESVWEEGGPGPRRRVYLISEDGKNELAFRIAMMKNRKARIEALISAYDRSPEQAARQSAAAV